MRLGAGDNHAGQDTQDNRFSFSPHFSSEPKLPPLQRYAYAPRLLRSERASEFHTERRTQLLSTQPAHMSLHGSFFLHSEGIFLPWLVTGHLFLLSIISRTVCGFWVQILFLSLGLPENWTKEGILENFFVEEFPVKFGHNNHYIWTKISTSTCIYVLISDFFQWERKRISTNGSFLSQKFPLRIHISNFYKS